MQLVPGWKNEDVGKVLDVSPLIEPLFLCNCMEFLRKQIALAEKHDNLTPQFVANVYGIFKLLKPMFGALGVPWPPAIDQLPEEIKQEWQ